jgi:hypothetical protein
MSSVSQSFPDLQRRQYIASDQFDTSIFTYTTYTDASLATRGRLVVHPDATPAKCGPRSILRENGKKLHSGTHPDLKDPTTTLPYTYLVGVYDVVSGISGFINPNASFLSVLTTDKSYQDDLGAYQVEASFNLNLPGVGSNYPNTGGQILGPSVYTGGTIQTIGLVECSEAHSTQLVHTNGYFLAGENSISVYPAPARCNVNYGAGTMNAQSNITSLSANIYASNGTVLGSNVVALSNITANTGDLRVTTGRLILNSNNTGVANMTGGTIDGSFRKLYVTANACRSTSRVFFTYKGVVSNPGILSAEEMATNQFRIVSTNTADGSQVQWIVVN